MVWHPRSRARSLLLTFGAVLLLVVASCGSGSTSQSASGSGSGGLTHIDVGIIPVGGAAPLMLGIKKGFFKQEGLSVTTHIAKGGAALVPPVVSGQYQFSWSNNVSLVTAASKGLKVNIVAMADGTGKDPDPPGEEIVVPKDSPIHTVKDLNGKTIATNTIGSIIQLAVMVTMKKHGADPFSAHFVEIGLPDMAAALSKHRIDAAPIKEPFLTQAKSEGFRPITDAFREVQEGYYISSWFTTPKYVSGHKKVVHEFQQAIFKSNKYAESHPKEVRAIVPTYTKISAATVNKMVLPHWAAAVPPKSMLDLTAKYCLEFKFIKKLPDVASMLPNLT